MTYRNNPPQLFWPAVVVELRRREDKRGYFVSRIPWHEIIAEYISQKLLFHRVLFSKGAAIRSQMRRERNVISFVGAFS